MSYITEKIKEIVKKIQENTEIMANRFSTNPLKYTIIVILIFLFSSVIYYTPYNTKSNTFDKYQGNYYASLVLFVLLFSFYVFKFVPRKYKQPFFILTSIFVFLIIAYQQIRRSAIFGIVNDGAGKYLLPFLIGLIPAVLLFRSVKRHLTNMDGITGFVINFILYIPCLFDNLLEYLKGQFARTSNITYVLLGLEALLITAYVLLPPLVSNIAVGTDAYPVMNEARFIGDNDNVQLDYNINEDVYPRSKEDLLPNAVSSFEKGKNDFSLSMWLYLNSQNEIVPESKIFSYEDIVDEDIDDKNVHPAIYYIDQENGKNKIGFKLSNTNDLSFDIYIESQKWNNIVFNYNGNVVDIFINGNLVKTHIIDNGVQITDSDIFKFGNKEIDGAMCNIKYYKKPLTKYQITSIYNLLKGQNPPINNIM